MKNASTVCSPRVRRGSTAGTSSLAPPRPGRRGPTSAAGRRSRPRSRRCGRLESFFGYPGPRLLRAIEDQIAQGDAGDVARLVQRINTALMSDSYRADASDWETADDAAEGPGAVRLPTPSGHG